MGKAPETAKADRRHEQTYWNETSTADAFPRLGGEIRVDAAIIGGGIVGVTAARRLKDLGLMAVVIEAQETALRKMLRLAAEHHIDCDLERKDAYTYTCEKTHVREIEEEVAVARRLRLPASLVDRAGLPFAYWPQDIG